MTIERPKVVVLAGPNGAGKTTSAAQLLLGALKVHEFVNADTIAQGLSAFAQERVAFEAGRIMLTRLKELATARASFAFETTLATRSYAPWLAELRTAGYRVHLVFLWLPNADVAVARVTARVRLGGHGVPEATVRRRYESGLANFFDLYMPLADNWRIIDNGTNGRPRLVAVGRIGRDARIKDPQRWQSILSSVRRK